MLKVSKVVSIINDAKRLGIDFTEEEQYQLDSHTRYASFYENETIYAQHKISQHWLYITSGIASSQQVQTDGSRSIARFFESSQLCGNLTSTWLQGYANDALVASTGLEGIEIEHEYFKQEYMSGANVGLYFRSKVIETLMYDKEIIVLKTICDIKMGYEFLFEYHPEVLKSVKKKEIAAFLGVTPQGLSKFLRNTCPE
ncbi:MAG: hypothetical protein AAGB12_03500 [Pseudomonadota bacterium]